jgi:hypothetical protein
MSILKFAAKIVGYSDGSFADRHNPVALPPSWVAY